MVLVAVSPADRRVAEVVESALAGEGFELVRARVRQSGGRTRIQLMVERADREVDLEDCARLSRVVSERFEIEPPPGEDWALEVSSPGIDRPLTRKQDFERFAGSEVKAELSEPLDGRRRFRGELVGLGGESEAPTILLALDGAEKIALPLALLARIRVIPDPSVFREAFARGAQESKGG